MSTRTEQDKDEALVGILRQTPGLAVVYASTRRTVERITSLLNDARVAAVAYHAGLDDAHRRDVQDAFMKERVRVIVATNAFGMGIDKPNVQTRRALRDAGYAGGVLSGSGTRGTRRRARELLSCSTRFRIASLMSSSSRDRIPSEP